MTETELMVKIDEKEREKQITASALVIVLLTLAWFGVQYVSDLLLTKMSFDGLFEPLEIAGSSFLVIFMAFALFIFIAMLIDIFLPKYRKYREGDLIEDINEATRELASMNKIKSGRKNK